MNPPKGKMLLAPILAIALALFLAGSVGFLPQNPSQNHPLPLPTSYDTMPPPLPTSPPVAQISAPLNGNLVSILSAVAAIVVGIVAACLLFSESKLKKELVE